MQVGTRHTAMALLVFLAWGGAHRYIRMLPGTGSIELAVYALQAAFATYGLILLAGAKLDKIDVAILLCLFALAVAYLKAAMWYGAGEQVQFAVKYILPLAFFYFARFNTVLDARRISFALHGLFFVAFSFLVVEFAAKHILNIPLFSFAEYWEQTGVEGYHGSGVQYGFSDDLYARPWGFMAMPQATGSAMSAFAIYFLVVHKGMIRYAFGAVATVGILISGSRTGLLVFLALGWLVVFTQGKRSKTVLLLTSVIFLIVSAIIGALFLHFNDPGRVAGHFLISVHSFFGYYLGLDIFDFTDGVTTRRLNNVAGVLDMLFGQGVESEINHVLGLGEIHLLNNIVRVGIVASSFMALALWWMLTRLRTWFRTMNCEADATLVTGFTFFAAALLAGSLHYDVAARYPMSLALFLVLGFLVRVASTSTQPAVPNSRSATADTHAGRGQIVSA